MGKIYFILYLSFVFLSCDKKPPTSSPLPKPKVTCDSIGLIKLDDDLEFLVGKWELVETEIIYYNLFNCFYLYTSVINANDLTYLSFIELTENGDYKVFNPTCSPYTHKFLYFNTLVLNPIS